jgi:hypothetical protein
MGSYLSLALNLGTWLRVTLTLYPIPGAFVTSRVRSSADEARHGSHESFRWQLWLIRSRLCTGRRTRYVPPGAPARQNVARSRPTDFGRCENPIFTIATAPIPSRGARLPEPPPPRQPATINPINFHRVPRPLLIFGLCVVFFNPLATSYPSLPNYQQPFPPVCP